MSRPFYKWIIWLSVVLVVCGIRPPESLAGPSEVRVVINGEVRDFNPKGQVVQGRTMLPVRYIIEDPAVRGTVSWDENKRQVTIVCNNNRIVFTIGSLKAYVNEAEKTLDVAPYIYEGRTYIPLRFFAEHMGAVVGWKATTRTAIVNFGPAKRVLGYYYYGTPDTLDHPALTDVAFRWLETDGDGNLFYEYWPGATGEVKRKEALDKAREKGIKVHASVMLMGWDEKGKNELHRLLSVPENRRRLVQNLVNHARQFRYDGINIDLEGVPYEDRNYFVVFLQELGRALNQDGRLLSVAVPARTKNSLWHKGYDYAGIGQAADLVMVMAYDYNYSVPGPSAPQKWVEEVVNYAASLIPADKLLLGIGAYGYDWDLVTGVRKTVTQDSLSRLLKGYKVTWGFDNKSYTPYLTYIDANGHKHIVWYDNKTSFNEKVAVAWEKNLAGIGVWQLRGALVDFFSVLGE